MTEDEIITVINDYVEKYAVQERSEIEQHAIQLSKDYVDFLESSNIPLQDKMKLYRMYIDGVVVASTITEKMYQEKMSSIQEMVQKIIESPFE